MVELNKDEHVWVCFEMVRVQNAHAVQDCGLTVGLAEEFLPSMRYSIITENTCSISLA